MPSEKERRILIKVDNSEKEAELKIQLDKLKKQYEEKVNSVCLPIIIEERLYKLEDQVINLNTLKRDIEIMSCRVQGLELKNKPVPMSGKKWTLGELKGGIFSIYHNGDSVATADSKFFPLFCTLIDKAAIADKMHEWMKEDQRSYSAMFYFNGSARDALIKKYEALQK